MTADTWMQLAAGLGDFRLALAGTLLAVGFLACRRDYHIARVFLFGIALCIAATATLKLIGLVLERWSISAVIGSPSGHTALGTTFVGSIALVLSHNRSARAGTIILACAMLAILVIADSRIANDAHTRFEVLEGLVIGLVGLIPLAFLLFRRKSAQGSDIVPAWPLLLIIAALVVTHAVFPMPDLNTESIVRLVAGLLPVSYH